MKNNFSTWLNSIINLQPSMFWCHTTDAYALRSLIHSGSFQLKECPLLREKLTYFFYGRPAYKKLTATNIRQTSNAPVVIILKSEIVSHAKRIFPFDSGAFINNRYIKWMHPQMNLADFDISSVPNAQSKHVQAFYGSNRSYFECIANVEKEKLASEFEAEAIAGLVTDLNSEDSDDRKITVEMVVDQIIPFTDEYIDTIVGPKSLLNVSWLNEFLIKFNISYIPYDLNFLKSSIEYQSLFEERAKNVQVRNGLIL